MSQTVALLTLVVLVGCQVQQIGGRSDDAEPSLDGSPITDATAADAMEADAEAPADAAPDDAALPDAIASDDAEPQDLGPADTGVAMEGCTGSNALFCEDFESLALGPANSPRWSGVTSNTGSLTIDDTRARGAQSLLSHTEGGTWAFIRIPFAPPNNSFFGRVYVYVTEFPTAPDWAHFTLVEAAGAEPGFIRPIGGQFVPQFAGGPGSFWGIGSDGGPTGDWTDWRLSAPTESGRWLCMEFELDANDNRIQVWIDGVANPELSVTTAQHGGNQVDFVFPTFDRVTVGWQLYQPGPTPPAFDVWLDDIVFDAQQVGCP